MVLVPAVAVGAVGTPEKFGDTALIDPVNTALCPASAPDIFTVANCALVPATEVIPDKAPPVTWALELVKFVALSDVTLPTVATKLAAERLVTVMLPPDTVILEELRLVATSVVAEALVELMLVKVADVAVTLARLLI